MSRLYLDPISGISGDMMLGLLVDLGVKLEEIEQTLKLLPISGYTLEQRREKRHGIDGCHIEVHCEAKQPHRPWSEIDAMLAQSDLPAAPKALARRIFRRLGDAEAKVHATSIDDVHFHEVGAVDAIVDIVGSAIGLSLLKVENIICAPLPLSSGLTHGAHGAIPLPAPATLELLRGCPVRDANSLRELVTPTGAAIAAEAAQFAPLPEMTIERIGYGVGGWELEDRPNLLRGIIGASTQAEGMERDTVTILESHLDDCPAEWLGSLMQRLMQAGALDVAFTPIQMKKNRPATKITVTAPRTMAEALSQIILLESSAIGVRMHQAERLKLRREEKVIDTPLGQARVKLIYSKNELVRITPEHDSCEELAANTGKPLPEIYRIVTTAANRLFELE
ncbi:MAG: nickel pincer cofactor biosynthesis protein LarC [Desulfuromonadales bacterium]|nr:nickel pincer cofactor biosynthesis protein LarC [Desulfuromonadales bacterium]